MKVAVLGASPKPDRYSNKAVRLLGEHGHEPIPVNPGYDEIEGRPVVHALNDMIPGSVDTLTVYVGPDRTADLAEDILQLKPSRVIFNPGAENRVLAEQLRAHGIEVLEACTLVLLNTGQFGEP
jgi:uncharacterized protein